MHYVWAWTIRSKQLCIEKFEIIFVHTVNIKSCVKLMIIMTEHFVSIASHIKAVPSISVPLLMSTLCVLCATWSRWILICVVRKWAMSKSKWFICYLRKKDVSNWISAQIDLMIWFIRFMKITCYISTFGWKDIGSFCSTECSSYHCIEFMRDT